jgi:hypothetical protein
MKRFAQKRQKNLVVSVEEVESVVSEDPAVLPVEVGNPMLDDIAMRCRMTRIIRWELV